MRIGIIGAGGIGGYLAAKFVASGAEVALIARGDHGAAIRDNGLVMHTPDGSETARASLVTDDPAKAGPCDLVIPAVKAHQLQDALDAMAPMMGSASQAVTFQNGVDAPDLLARAFGPERALMGTARIFVNITAPGELTLKPGPCLFAIGDMTGSQTSAAAARAISTFDAGGIDTYRCDDVRVDLWIKFLTFNAVSSTTAGARTDLGGVRDTPELWALFQELVAETAAVARAEGVKIASDAEEKIVAFAKKMPGHARASTAHDLELGRALEIDWICGSLARKGAELGVPVPASRVIYALLAPYRNGGGIA